MASANVPRRLLVALALVALIGFADASYLTAEHLRGVIPPCSTLSGCEQVLTSAYATVAGIPLAILGMAYYGTILVMLIAFLDIRDHRLLRGIIWFTTVGFAATLYFLYLQVFVLHAFCLYCLASAVTATTLFVLARQIRT